MPEGQNRSVLIHQLTRRRSQVPFAKPKGLVQAVLFHPKKPVLFVATQKNVRIYDLKKQELIKKLLSNARWISSMAIHPGINYSFHILIILFTTHMFAHHLILKNIQKESCSSICFFI